LPCATSCSACRRPSPAAQRRPRRGIRSPRPAQHRPARQRRPARGHPRLVPAPPDPGAHQPDAVNTTGFFDEIAVEIGDNYPLYGEVIDKIRWGQQKDVPNFSLKLAERSQKDGQAINAFCKRLYDHTFLAKYYYQKPEKIGRGTLQSAPNIRRFFAGEWLEWFALMKLLAFFQEKRGRCRAPATCR
jgi:hypothetical protein